jgi:hypothetical protein
MPATTPRPPSSEQVAAFDRNAWPRSIGIPGRNRRNPHRNPLGAGSRHEAMALSSRATLSLCLHRNASTGAFSRTPTSRISEHSRLAYLGRGARPGGRGTRLPTLSRMLRCTSMAGQGQEHEFETCDAVLSVDPRSHAVRTTICSPDKFGRGRGAAHRQTTKGRLPCISSEISFYS